MEIYMYMACVTIKALLNLWDSFIESSQFFVSSSLLSVALSGCYKSIWFKCFNAQAKFSFSSSCSLNEKLFGMAECVCARDMIKDDDENFEHISHWVSVIKLKSIWVKVYGVGTYTR